MTIESKMFKPTSRLCLYTFAEACCDMNSIEELEQALIDGPDATDMKEWGLTEQEWTEQVKAAIEALRSDETN